MRFGTFNYNQARAGVPERQLFDELVEQIELTDRLGFHEAWFAEHHGSDYSVLPAPNLVIAALARRTRRLRLGVLVNVLPLHDPLCLAEEISTLDILTEGRIDVGMGRGVPRDDSYYGFDRETAEARYEEALRVLELAWEEERFSFDGRFWKYQNASLRPRPVQQPHPPLFYGVTSPDSVDVVGRRGWNLAQMRQPLENIAANVSRYRAVRAAAGLAPDSGRVVLIRDIYVADSDERAWAEAAPSILRFWQIANDYRLGAEPVSPEDLRRFTSRFFYYRGGATLENFEEWGVSFIGSPETVARKVRAVAGNMGAISLCGLFSFGSLTHAQVARSLKLFATEVIPRVNGGN